MALDKLGPDLIQFVLRAVLGAVAEVVDLLRVWKERGKGYLPTRAVSDSMVITVVITQLKRVLHN